MKATGIVRRIDDLGRVVIPKEIRRTMRIREGDPLEIYTDREGEVIFKKYSPIGELSAIAEEYAQTLAKIMNAPVFICDRDAVLAACGAPKREYLDKKVSSDVETIMENRTLYYSPEKSGVLITEEGGPMNVRCAMPILSQGDLLGCVICGSVEDGKNLTDLNEETEKKLIQTAAVFLGKQMEN